MGTPYSPGGGTAAHSTDIPHHNRCLGSPHGKHAGLAAATLAERVDAGVVARVLEAGKLRGVSELCQSAVGSMGEEDLERLRTMLLAMTDVHVVRRPSPCSDEIVADRTTGRQKWPLKR
jgi:hypothetical protein